MKRQHLVKLHLAATAVATLTIFSFFSFSLIAEIIGTPEFIRQVKTGILYSLPLLLVAMPALALSGKKLAGASTHPMILKKLNRMKMMAANGLMLVSLAIYLYYHAVYKSIDSTFFIIQMIELTLGACNLLLIGLNVRDGLRLSGRLSRVSA